MSQRRNPAHNRPPAIGHGWTRDDWVKSIRGVPREKIFYREGALNEPTPKP